MAFDKAQHRRSWLEGLNGHAARQLAKQMQAAQQPPPEQGVDPEAEPDLGASAGDLESIMQNLGG